MTSTKKSKEEQTSGKGFPESTIPLFFEQMSLWKEFVESEEGKDVAQAGLDFAQISTRHMSDMFRKIGEALPRTMSTDEAIQKSREIYQICARSYSQMFKEAMVTPSILKQNAKALDAFLDWKIETDRASQEALNNLGIPTRNDMDEISERLYLLDKKMDGLHKELSLIASRSRGQKKG